MLVAHGRRRPRSPGNERVPVERAIELYDRLGNWRRVAERLTHASGTAFTYHGIVMAVRRAERRK